MDDFGLRGSWTRFAPRAAVSRRLIKAQIREAFRVQTRYRDCGVYANWGKPEHLVLFLRRYTDPGAFARVLRANVTTSVRMA